jgi:hypothetical protein
VSAMEYYGALGSRSGKLCSDLQPRPRYEHYGTTEHYAKLRRAYISKTVLLMQVALEERWTIITELALQCQHIVCYSGAGRHCSVSPPKGPCLRCGESGYGNDDVGGMKLDLSHPGSSFCSILVTYDVKLQIDV